MTPEDHTTGYGHELVILWAGTRLSGCVLQIVEGSGGFSLLTEKTVERWIEPTFYIACPDGFYPKLPSNLQAKPKPNPNLSRFTLSVTAPSTLNWSN